MVDLVGFELSFEQTELHEANQAARTGDYMAALGHLSSLSAFLNVSLPPMPVPKRTAYENQVELKSYFFRCKKLIGARTYQRIDDIRASYANPFTVTVKESKSTAKSQ